MIKEKKQTQTLNQIANAAADVLMVFLPDLMDTNNSARRITEYRYMTFGLMEKAGYTHQQIADHFKMNRENITKGLSKLDDWLKIYKDTQGDYQRLNARALK